MNNIPETISKTIDVLAEKFGSTGIHLYTVMVQGKFAESLCFSILGLIFCLVGIFFGYLQKKSWEKENNTSYPDFPFYGLGSCTLLLIGIIIIGENIVGVFAPEYVILMSLIK